MNSYWIKKCFDLPDGPTRDSSFVDNLAGRVEDDGGDLFLMEVDSDRDEVIPFLLIGNLIPRRRLQMARGVRG